MAGLKEGDRSDCVLLFACILYYVCIFSNVYITPLDMTEDVFSLCVLCLPGDSTRCHTIALYPMLPCADKQQAADLPPGLPDEFLPLAGLCRAV